MGIELEARTVLKVGFLIGLIFLLGYLVVKLMVLDETINMMINVNKTFV
jgi:flagellar biogenesis protein FliO